MREGKEDKSPSSEDKTQSTGSLGGLGYTIPGIRLSDDFRARLKACDAVALQSTLKQDAANLAAQLDRFNSAYAIATLLHGEHKSLWSTQPLMADLCKPFTMEPVPAALIPERCGRIRNERQVVRKEIENILKVALAEQGFKDPYTPEYHAIRTYHGNLMYEVRRLSLIDQREIRKAIFIARSAVDPKDYNQLLTDIQRTPSGSYAKVLDSFYERHSELQPHRQAFDTIFEYLNQGRLHPPALPTVVQAFLSLPQECRGAMAGDFRAWFDYQTTFFMWKEQSKHSHEVETVTELEQVAIAAQHLTQFPDAADGLIKYMFLNVLRNEGRFRSFNAVRELRDLNTTPWYEKYNAWLVGSGQQNMDSLHEFPAGLDGTGNESAPLVPTQTPADDIDPYGGAQALSTERLKGLLGDTWLASLRRLWHEQGCPKEKDIRSHPLFTLITEGDSSLQAKWVKILLHEED
jgi:hypothetical protein